MQSFENQITTKKALKYQSFSNTSKIIVTPEQYRP